MAIANDNLRFQPIETNKEKRLLSYVKKIGGNSFYVSKIAKVDLNGDLIDEYVLRPDCPAKSLCPHLVIALQDFTPIVIGEFDAHKILISHKKTYGIRHIIVYNEPYNDFKSQTARWNPFSFRYRFD